MKTFSYFHWSNFILTHISFLLLTLRMAANFDLMTNKNEVVERLLLIRTDLGC